jgi:hypothetical protein
MSGAEGDNALAVASGAARFLEAIDHLFRSLGLDVMWRYEREELATPRAAEPCRETTCERCAGRRVRISGRHVCLGAH